MKIVKWNNFTEVYPLGTFNNKSTSFQIIARGHELRTESIDYKNNHLRVKDPAAV